MKGTIDLSYNPYDKTARTMNKRSNWETGTICLADVPQAGQTVYINRPQNNAYAEECKVEILPSHAKRENNVLFKARTHDNWAHYFTVYDIGNDVFFDYGEAQTALMQTLRMQIVVSLMPEDTTDTTGVLGAADTPDLAGDAD